VLLLSRPNGQRRRKVVTAVFDTAAEISLMSKDIVEDLIGEELRAPQLPVVKGAVVSVFGNGTKKVKRQTLIGFEIEGISYEQVFMAVCNLVFDAILGINFLQENKFVIN
jgi:hypothetical protein